MTKLPLRYFCTQSICQILAHFDIVAKNDEIAPGAIFVSDQPSKFLHIPTPSRKMTKLTPARFLFPINLSNFSPFLHSREKLQYWPLRDFLFPINLLNFSPFRHSREK
jgi:hypothetical protein